ncbi:MAG: response regulator [Coriobacteriia bacterium]|nr:response regulator [Coriobacteriia bacterium]MBN2839877.1 response regulator [Coriobacteriia bacterium]
MSRILVVDDAAEARHLLRTILRHAGHEIAEASNGSEALQAIHDGSFDLVISDGLMPVMDGFRLCIELRRDPSTSMLPFILYTATFTDPDDAQLASTMGADAYLLKPMDPADILQAVNEVLDRQGPGRHDVLPDDRLVEVFESYSDRMEQKLDKKVADLAATRALRDSYHALLDTLPVHVLTLDHEGHIDFVNTATRAFIGSTDTADILDALHPKDRDSALAFVESLLNDPRPARSSMSVRRHDGAYALFEVTARAYNSPGGEPLGFVLAGEDITRGEQQRELLLHAADYDPLTDLPTRHVFDRRFDEILRNVGKGARCALLFIDCDDLKGVNDRYGFDVGDVTLANLARVIVESGRPGDLVARLCATEFVVLAEDFGWNEAGELSNTIRAAVAQGALVPAAPEMRLGVNISINVIPEVEPPGADRVRGQLTAAPADAESRLLMALQGRPAMSFDPIYSLEDRRLVRCSVRYAFAVDERLVTGDELALGIAKHGVARRIAARVVELALEHTRRTGIPCSVPLTLANVLDPTLFERAELAAAREPVDLNRLLFEISDCDAGGIQPPMSWLAAARRSPIKLVHVCDDLSSLIAEHTAALGADEVVVRLAEVIDRDGQVYPGALPVIAALRESNVIVTVTGVDDPASLEALRSIGVAQAAGDALSPVVPHLDQAPRTLPGKD